MNRRNIIVMGMALIVGIGSAPAILAADDAESLQKRFKERYDKLVELKKQGQVGETWEGYVQPVSDSPDAATKKLTDEENADRGKLYALIAEKENTTADKVASRNAARNFEKARPGEYLKGKDGKWQKKA